MTATPMSRLMWLRPRSRSPSYYGPVTGGYGSYSYNSGYDTNYIGPWRERKLMGLD